MKPAFPDSLSFVQASYQTPYGLAKSEWHRKDGFLTWDITVPPNTRAIVMLPSGKTSEVGSGDHHFDINTKNN
jgi:alpha-L-rhamnosidase